MASDDEAAITILLTTALSSQETAGVHRKTVERLVPRGSNDVYVAESDSVVLGHDLSRWTIGEAHTKPVGIRNLHRGTMTNSL